MGQKIRRVAVDLDQQVAARTAMEVSTTTAVQTPGVVLLGKNFQKEEVEMNP